VGRRERTEGNMKKRTNSAGNGEKDIESEKILGNGYRMGTSLVEHIVKIGGE